MSRLAFSNLYLNEDTDEWIQMPAILLHPQKTGYCPTLCPKVSRALLPRLPLAFVETLYPSKTTPLEYMVDML